MNRSSATVEGIRGCRPDEELPAQFRAFITCFNRQCFYEAHAVLEPLWLAARGGPQAGFYKGLIQLAGAFVHVQKNRQPPAGALFRLALHNLMPYPNPHLCLDLVKVRALIAAWLEKLAGSTGEEKLLEVMQVPQLQLPAAPTE